MVTFKTDSVGDIFCEKYQQYVTESLMLGDTINQLEENYENIFGNEPTSLDMTKAIGFIRLFLAEIVETCPNTRKSVAAMEILGLIEDDNPLGTAKNITEYRSK